MLLCYIPYKSYTKFRSKLSHLNKNLGLIYRTYALHVIDYVHSRRINRDEDLHIAISDPGCESSDGSLDLPLKEGRAVAW